MSELTTIPSAELEELRQRLSRLAREKAQLQLIALLMNRLGELPGLEHAVEGMLQFVMDILGGLNVTVFYRFGNGVQCVDVKGRRELLGEADDDLVRQVFETGEFVSRVRDLGQAGIVTGEASQATTWVMPLMVGTELVGVLRMDDLLVAGSELRDEVQTFLRYASLVLKNEISGEARLRQAFDEVGRANRAEAALAERHSTLRGILEGTTSPIFSVDREYRYVAFNRSHASVMRALYGADIDIGRSILDCMTVAADREKARANLDRALAGEHLVELSDSGEEQRARRYFEVAHHPVPGNDGQVIGVAVFAHDVTERKRAEEERRANLWSAESLDQVNRAIQGARDLEQLMSEVLGASLAIFGCDRAFLLYPCDPHAAAYRVPMERTRPEFPGALAQGLDVPVDAESARVLRAARAAPGPVTFAADSQPPLPRVLTERFGVRSQIAMAIYPKVSEPYMFGLHQCSQPRAWTSGEARLFQDIGWRLSDALASLLAHRELQESEKRLRDERGLFVGGPTVVFKWKAQAGWPVEYVSPNVADQLGYAPEELTSGEVPYAAIVHPDDLARVGAEVAAYGAQGLAAFEQTYRLARSDGRYRWVDDFTTVIRRPDGTISHYLGYVLDITERKQAALDLAKANRALRMLSDSNQALVRITDETTLLDEVCRIAVEVGGYRMAWVGLAEQDAARTVRPVAHAGLESGYLASANVTWADEERGRGPSGTAIRSQQPCIARSILTDPAFAPWREAAVQRGYKSIIALPLVSEGRALGVLGIYSVEADAFDAKEVAILEELASDLAFGIAALRTRAARDQAEQALQASEERYRTLIQRIRAGVVVHAADSQVLASNALAQELLGLTEAQMLGKTAIDPAWHFLREDETAMPPGEYPVSQVLATRRALRDLVLGVRRPQDRRDVWLLVNADPVGGRDGEVAQVVVTFVDITERKRLEEEMRRSAAAIEQAAETIMITDPDAVIQYVNPAFTRVTGYSREEAVGQTPRFLQSGKHGREHYRELWATLLRGETWRGHLINKRKDGTLFEEDASLSPVRDERGKVVHYVGVKRDVTQEVALEAQLRQSQKLEAIGRLAGGVAHDFNNLLQAMLSHTQLLQIAPERVDTELAEMEAQIRRGAALTRQLLLLSRGQEAQRERLDLNEVVSGVSRLLRRLVRENVALSIELGKGSAVVEADRGQLEQVLMNLTINAADAMPGGGRLSIRTGCEGALAFFAVEDTGCGIPEAIRSKVFEPLFTTKPVGHGTGLGLSVVEGIVSQHGGRIDLTSTEGVGTTVRVLLPRVSVDEAPRVALPGDPSAFPGGQGERVLVVEDEAGARAGLRAVLRSLGYQVAVVGSGGEARALPVEPAFEALVSDLMLPDVDGTALARELLSRWPDLRMIFMSGYSEEDVLARAADLGAVHFLQKPFDMSALARLLRQTLSEGPPPAVSSARQP